MQGVYVGGSPRLSSEGAASSDSGQGSGQKHVSMWVIPRSLGWVPWVPLGNCGGCVLASSQQWEVFTDPRPLSEYCLWGLSASCLSCQGLSEAPQGN